MLNIKHNRNSSIFFMMITIGMFFVMLYYTYNAYKKYDSAIETYEHIVLIKKISTVLNNIDNERTFSAIYMGTNHKKDLNELNKYRQIVNIEIDTILEYILEDTRYYTYESSLLDIQNKLQYSRDRVNVLSMDYNHILFESYVDKIVNPLILILTDLTKSSSLTENYFENVLVSENLSSEKSFIAFILSGQKLMDNKDLLKWEYILNNNTLTSEVLDTLRGKVLIDSVDGRYHINVEEWVKANVTENNIIKEKENSIIVESQNNIENKLDNLKYKVIKYILLSILALIIFIGLLYLYNKKVETNRLLVDTLSDLESDLNAHQRKEIKRVLKENDTFGIYKFLVNAIKEPNIAKDHFLANMSHEIRTPLNGIIGFTNILKETELQEDQQEFLSIIEESSNNLISIVNDILDFSKVASGKVEIENLPFNIMEKFEVTIDSYAAKAAQKNINLNLMIDPELPIEIMGDGAKISQVIINLLSNAVKFTNPGGSIDININKAFEDNEIVKFKFSIKDSGIGMSIEQQEKVFDAFSQADISTSREFGGTGLGLTISKKFILLMGGELELISKEGDGSTFFFSLELKKRANLTKRESLKVTNINVAYATIENKKIESDNLKTYIEYNGGTFKNVDYLELLETDSSKLADIIFVNHYYIEDESIISSLLDLDTKIILISRTEIENSKVSFKNKISKVIYEPVNFSKAVRSLNSINKNLPSSSENIKKIHNVNSEMVFTGLSVLIVEDNIINQKLLYNILNNFEIDITTANNGLEAFNLRKKSSFDIIFMDIQMPVMDGIESAREILLYEKENNLKHIPIVALTANALVSDKEKYLDLGMDRYITKPINISELTTIIEDYFPLKEIRNSIPMNIENNLNEKIILYKETKLTAKIYSSVLTNLGYVVDTYSSAEKFIENIESKSYKFALFDSITFKKINSENFVVELIKESGAIPIAFVDKENDTNYCETLNYVGHADKISEKLLECKV